MGILTGKILCNAIVSTLDPPEEVAVFISVTVVDTLRILYLVSVRGSQIAVPV